MTFFFAAMENDDDRDLAERLYLQYRQAVFHIAIGFLKNEVRAEDAVCDVFERVCKHIEMFRPLDDNKMRLLIVVYSKNVCRNILRHDKIFTFEELNDDCAAEEQTEALALDRVDCDRIFALVQSLDDHYADVCMLKFFAGLRDAEIAVALGISEANVRVRLTRSRAILREKLTKEGIHA